MENPQQFILKLEELFADDRLEEVNEHLLEFFREQEDEDLINDALLQKSQLQNFNRRVLHRTAGYADREYNEIRIAVLQLKSSAKHLLSQTTSPKQSATAKTTSTPTESKLVFDDDFANNQNNWPSEKDQIKCSIVENGRYFIEHFRNEKGWRFTQEIEVDQRRNFAIKTRMLFLEGTETNGYGLSWGAGEGLNSFSFVISANGLFNIVYFVNGQRFPIREWEKNPAINKGSAMNELEIIKKGETLHFKVNDEVVATHTFISFFGNKFGFVLYQNMKVAVDLFQIRN